MGEQKDFAVIGNLRISESVIATIAPIAVEEIDGVTLSPSFSTSDFRELIGHARLRRGVKVSFAEPVFTNLPEPVAPTKATV